MRPHPKGNTMTTAHRTPASEALDARTPGRKGTARAGFHLYFRSERFVTASGIPGNRTTPERCTCSAKANHATAPVKA
jgi:hypothetical protein